MRCEKCHYEQGADFEICPSCASPVRELHKQGSVSHTRAKKKKISRKKKIARIKRLSLLGAALVSFIVIIVLLFGGNGPKFEYPSHCVDTFVNNSGVTCFIFDGSHVIEFSEEESAIQKIELSRTGKYAVVMTQGGLLYVVSKNKCVKLDDGDEVVDFKLAPFADIVVYLKDYDPYEGGTLCYSNLSKPSSSSTVSKGVYREGGLDFIVSPSGESFAYVTEYDGMNWTYKVSKKGSAFTKWKGENVVVDAVSDSGKYIYYNDNEGNFRVNGKIICGTENNSAFLSVYYDGNATDALVSYNYNAVSYTVLVTKGKIRDDERQKGNLNSMVLPEEIHSFDGRYYDVDTFVATAVGIMNGTDEIHYYIANKSGEFKRLFAGVLGLGEMYISTDCKTIYFRKDQQGSIKYMNLAKYNDQPKEYKSDVEVACFKMSKDGEHIYFIDNEGTLYYQKTKSKAVKICDGVNANEFYVTDSGNAYFGTAYNGVSMELLFSKKGAKYTKVRQGPETVAIHYSAGANELYFETENEVYTASSGKGELVYQK